MQRVKVHVHPLMRIMGPGKTGASPLPARLRMLSCGSARARACVCDSAVLRLLLSLLSAGSSRGSACGRECRERDFRCAHNGARYCPCNRRRTGVSGCGSKNRVAAVMCQRAHAQACAARRSLSHHVREALRGQVRGGREGCPSRLVPPSPPLPLPVTSGARKGAGMLLLFDCTTLVVSMRVLRETISEQAKGKTA